MWRAGSPWLGVRLLLRGGEEGRWAGGQVGGHQPRETPGQEVGASAGCSEQEGPDVLLSWWGHLL